MRIVLRWWGFSCISTSFHCSDSSDLNKLWFMTSVTAAPKSNSRGCELRYGPLGMHRMCLGCFESDSKIFFSTPSYRYFLKFWSEESRPWGYIKCLKLVLNLARKKIIFTVGGPKYDFRSFFKIKLKPGQHGYHSTPFGISNHPKTVCWPLSCHKNWHPTHN